MHFDNKGFDPAQIQALKDKMKSANSNFILNDETENSDEFVNFYFVGKYEGREVIYDVALFTLRVHHNSELYEIAEHKAAKRFPQFKQISYEEDENGDLAALDDLEEEIGLYMAEIMMELEEEEAVKVKEFVELDPHLDYGIGIDAALNIDKITEADISRFVTDFNEDTLDLDDTLYSFEDLEEDEKVKE